MMPVYRAAVTPAFFTATRSRECARGKKSHTQNQGQDNADSFQRERSNLGGILIHSDLVYIKSICHVNRNNRKIVADANNMIMVLKFIQFIAADSNCGRFQQNRYASHFQFIAVIG
jgi:hypothetical protein